MSVLWSRLMGEVEIHIEGIAELKCPLCRQVLGRMTGTVGVFTITNLAWHQCPNVWDVLERHLVDKTGTLGFTRDGIPDPIPPQVSAEVAELPPGSYRVVTHNGKLELQED